MPGIIIESPAFPSVLQTVDFLLLGEDFQATICRGCSRA